MRDGARRDLTVSLEVEVETVCGPHAPFSSRILDRRDLGHSATCMRVGRWSTPIGRGMYIREVRWLSCHEANGGLTCTQNRRGAGHCM
jgi:hypothetical protein